MEADTVRQALERFAERGYTGSIRAEGAELRDLSTGRTYAPEQLRIDHLARFEGESDPQDEAIVFAVRDPSSGRRFAWVLAYGPGMDPIDGELARRIPDARREGT